MLPKVATTANIGDKDSTRYQLVLFLRVPTGSEMPNLQSPAIDLKSILPSDRFAVVNNGSIHGAGLVAKAPFWRVELILPLIGKLTLRTYRTIQIDVNKHLDGALIAFMNHSCQPTSTVHAAARGVVAAVELKAGDEVTFSR